MVNKDLANRKGPPQKDDQDLIHDYIILTSLIIVLERDIVAMTNSRLKLQHAYSVLLQGALEKGVLELKEVKKQLRAHGIKVYERKKLIMNFHLGNIFVEGIREKQNDGPMPFVIKQQISCYHILRKNDYKITK
jgi:hypothetical protein